MTKYSKAGQTLLTVMLMLFLLALTGCWQTDNHYLTGNKAVRLQQNESAPWQGWLIQDEAMARILEAAEACRATNSRSSK